MEIKRNSLVLFYGDSITDAGRDRENLYDLGNGYPKYIAQRLNLQGIKVINKGISGDKTSDLLNRYAEDVLAVKPDYISIMIGINDVWHHFGGLEYITDEEFKDNLEKLFSHIKNDLGIPIFILEPYYDEWNEEFLGMRKELNEKVLIIRRLAQKFASQYLVMDAVFAENAIGNPKGKWTTDGVHPTIEGHKLIAKEWLKKVTIVD